MGHFTQGVWESANKVGCAVSTSRSGGYNKAWLACDYNYGNMLESPVYKAGKMASECNSGTNPKYEGLCAVGEKYENN